MKLSKTLVAAALMTAASWTSAAATLPAPAAGSAPATEQTKEHTTEQVKAAHDLLAAMQAEKMMRMTAGMSRYANDKQRQAVMAKLDKVAPEEIYRRLAAPVARLVTPETAAEMTRFYASSYGQRVLHDTYNSRGAYMAGAPVPTPSEKAALKRPAYVQAAKAFTGAEPAIRHEAFVLVTQIANK